MQNQLLLIKDVDSVGRSGDIVTVRPGYARNFLLPQKLAVVADKYTLKLQAKLQEERSKQAEIDTKESLLMAERIQNLELSMITKVDPDGHMYGSVSATDIMKLLENEGIVLERKNVVLPQPIKAIGDHKISLKLKEGIPAAFSLKIISDKPLTQKEKFVEAHEEEIKEVKEENAE